MESDTLAMKAAYANERNSSISTNKGSEGQFFSVTLGCPLSLRIVRDSEEDSYEGEQVTLLRQDEHATN